MSGEGAGVRVAIETSTRVGSVAVGRGGEVLAAVELGAQTRHASMALPALDDALRAAGVDRSEIGGVVVGAGPGSFTGVRVAGATAKGLTTSLGVPLLAYSSLLSLVFGRAGGGPWAEGAAGRGADGQADGQADGSTRPDAPVCGLFDARRGEVYAGCWRVGGDALVEVLAPRVGTVPDVVGALAGAGHVVFVGEGVERYAGALEAAAGEAGLEAELTGPALRPTATALLGLAHRFPAAGRVSDPVAWEPLYVRGSSAERGIRG